MTDEEFFKKKKMGCASCEKINAFKPDMMGIEEKEYYAVCPCGKVWIWSWCFGLARRVWREGIEAPVTGKG